MKLNSLSVRNYRNLIDSTFVFDGMTVGIVGENGQGKTNLLESIFVLSTGDTWRGEEDADMIRFGESFCRVDGEFIHEDAVSLAVVIEKQEHTHRVKKKYLVNDISRKKETFVSNLAVVLFHPEDIQIVNGSPSSRRALLDECIGEVFPYYRKVISQYSKIVTSRNRLLDQIREGFARENQLEYWTESMVRLGCEVYSYRYRFFEYIAQHLDQFGVEYRPHVVCECSATAEEFSCEIDRAYRHRLQGNLQKEIMSATSQYGPHKDDYDFVMAERDIGRFGSRGEQRAALFAFKKAHVMYLQEVRKLNPILLLDDIFSEFDLKHRGEVAELCRGFQTFVTGTEEQFFKEEAFGFDEIYVVNGGLAKKM